MLSWILLIVVLAALVVLGIWASGHLFGRGEALPPMEETHDVIEANKRAVEQGRLDDIALEVVPRGYRQDQVDALIAQLASRSGGVTKSVARETSAPHSEERA